ncbi:MAG: hypothetical protein RLZZ86_2597 [Cyanobacteriota bacterium]|jgi:hypothetical protein
MIFDHFKTLVETFHGTSLYLNTWFQQRLNFLVKSGTGISLRNNQVFGKIVRNLSENQNFNSLVYIKSVLSYQFSFLR